MGETVKAGLAKSQRAEKSPSTIWRAALIITMSRPPLYAGQKGLENANQGGAFTDHILLFYCLKIVFIVALLLLQQKKELNKLIV